MWQDFVAWKALSGQIGKEEITRLVLVNTGKAAKGRKLVPRSAEHCRKLSEANLGKVLSLETRQKLTLIGAQRKNNLGKHWTVEHRAKIGASLRGNKNNTGHKNNLGHKWTPEMKTRASEAAKRRLQAKRSAN